MMRSSFQPSNEPDVGTITQSQVDELASQNRQLNETIAGTENRYRKCRTRERGIKAQVMYLLAARACRRVTDSYFGWRPGGLLILAAAFGAAFFVASLSWKFGLLGFALGTIASLLLLYLPSDERAVGGAEKLPAQLAALQAKNREAVDCLHRLREEQSLTSERLHRWEELLRQRQYRESQEYRRQQLLKRDWKSLRSVPFENFLEEVFQELGYVVETTNVTGDQGGDLIVVKDGHRIAIQVKGYLHSVSNSAVQEAHTAKDYYKCEACAVITNSLFTPAAKDVANRVKCILVDEETLPPLIMGAIDLWQLYSSLMTQPQTGSQYEN